MRVWSIPGVSRDHLRVTSDSFLSENSEIQLSEMKQQFKPTAHASEILLVTGIEHNS